MTATTPAEDWQLNKTVAECNWHMFENELLTDVTFIIVPPESQPGVTFDILLLTFDVLAVSYLL